MNRREMRALDASPGGWGVVGSASMTRYSLPKPDRRRGPRQCPFGAPGRCENNATHLGMANGVALTSGCEFHVAGWVRASDESGTGD